MNSIEVRKARAGAPPDARQVANYSWRGSEVRPYAEADARPRSPAGSLRSITAPDSLDVLRARIVLLAADGWESRDITAELGAGQDTVSKWRWRFAQQRLAGLTDQPGRGRKRQYTDHTVERIVEDTLHTTPEQATHWSTRTMAKHAGVSHTTVQRIWHAHQLKPHLLRTFKLSNDKHFVEKLRDVVGLYLNPPEHALVYCVDEKSQIQALDRTQPGLPLKKGRCGTLTHDYKRHGTTTLFAALNVLEGTVIGKCYNRHRHIEYLRFLGEVDRQTPAELDIHLIVDNYSTHKHERVKAWLKRPPRFHVHFIPTSSSWLNLVERFFRDITDRRIRRANNSLFIIFIPFPWKEQRAIDLMCSKVAWEF